MRLKLSLLAIILTAALIGIPYYLDAQIPRATAVLQVHPEIIPPNPGSFSRGSPHNLFETIVAAETLRGALDLLHSETREKKNHSDHLIENLREKISTQPRRGTDFIEITAKDESMGNAIRMANAVAQAFAHRQNEIEKGRAKRALEALDDELKAQEDLVEKAREDLIPLTGAYGIPDFGENQAPASRPQTAPVPPGAAQTISPKSTGQSLKPELSLTKYQQAKEAYDQARLMLRDMTIKQQDARFLLRTPRKPVTIHEYAR